MKAYSLTPYRMCWKLCVWNIF